MTDIREQLRAMPSSLNDACRTMEVAADQIEALVKALEGIAEFSSGDDTTLGALSRLVSIRNTALNVLAHVSSPPRDE